MLSGQSEVIGGTDRWESLRKTRSTSAQNLARLIISAGKFGLRLLTPKHTGGKETNVVLPHTCRQGNGHSSSPTFPHTISGFN